MLLRNQHAFQLHDEIESSCSAIFLYDQWQTPVEHEQYLPGNEQLQYDLPSMAS
jgi:hypothetical protein